MINKKNKAKSLAKIISQLNNSNNRKILGTIISLFSVLLIISFVSYLFEWKADDSVLSKEGYTIFNNETNNQIGGLGAQLSHRFIKLWFGISALLIPYLTLILGLSILGLRKFKLNKVVTNVLLALIILPITIHHFFDAMILAGGLGIFIDEILIQAIGNIGTSIVLITIISLNIIISFKINSKHLLKLNKFKIKGFTLRENKKVEAKDTEQILEENTNIIEEVKEENISETKTENQIEIKGKEDELIDDIGLEVISNKNEDSLSKSEIEKKLKELGDFDPTLELSKFKMPTMNLLNDYGKNKIEVDKSELEKNKNKIVETLGHYNIGITSISATVGPTITLYEIVPEAGVRISKIKNLEDDISLSLAAEGIRIIAPIPGKGTIGIEVPNANKNTVSMLEVLQSEKFQNSKMELPIAFGKTISNETFIVDLAKMPHLLMAGATGQGKSVGLNAILVSLLYKKHPSQIKFVLVDPKKVELTLFNKIERHYLAKLPDSEDAIITDTKKVVNTVNSLCIEMDERYELCKNAN